MTKTNVIRLLEQAKIKFEIYEYEVSEDDLSGMHIAEQTSLSPDIVFKTLVARGDKSGVIVLCLPVNLEINLKKAAAQTGNKKIEMLPLKELLPATGYIRGGCSPIGMKKKYPTYIHNSAQAHEKITVSAGTRGMQIMLSPHDLAGYTNATFCDFCN